MMPGGQREAFDTVEDILKKVSAQTDSGQGLTLGPHFGSM
jgi:6-phosphogluconate dehydrogenase